MGYRITTTMRIDSELIEGLRELKKRDGAPVSEHVRRAIQAWLMQHGIRRRPDRKRRALRRAP